MMTQQTETSECGLACLATASSILGAPMDMGDLRRKFPVSQRGLTLEDMSRIAGAMHMSARAVRCEIDELDQLRLPAVLHWGMSHFVVLIKLDRRGLVISDPAVGQVRLTRRDVSKRFTGIALELSRAQSFQRRKPPSPLRLTSLIRLTPDITSGLMQTLLLSLLLQAYVVASPFYMQLAVDEAATKGDRGILGVLAVAFGLFGIFNVGASALRSVALQKVSALLGWDMTGRLFHHLLRLPLPWFQRRRLADALSRFESIEPVRSLLANGLVGSIIDGLLAIVTLAMMLVFSWKLALVASASLAFYIAIRLAAISFTIRLAGEALTASIAEKGRRIEALRAIQTIKVMGAESQREAEWANRYADTLRTGQASGLAQISFGALQSLADTLSTVLIIYLGVVAIIDRQTTVGALIAFMAYRGQFAVRTQGLFETLVQWRMLDLHSDRISDIALTPPETGLDDVGSGHLELQGAIELRNLAFRYAPQDPFIFQSANARFEPGEFVAIVGPSGAGKTTLLKVLCGLYPSTAGEILIDGLPLSSWGARSFRSQLGVVMQDDELLTGSIAENVAFFAADIDVPWVWECLTMASIADEIRAMPMRAETYIGDMGSALSGGQKQRLLLARALYRRPKILLLDEATSHLDIARERQINQSIRALDITRIVIAHRPETIAAADRVVALNGGRLVEASGGSLSVGIR